MSTPDDKLQAALRVLRAEYLDDAPRRLAELWTAFARVQFGDAESLTRLQSLLHKLAGTGGAYGLPAVTDTARAAEQRCHALSSAGVPPTSSDVQQLRTLIQGVADAFDASSQE